jgi:hypothetical protein
MSNKQSSKLTLAFLETRTPHAGQSGGMTIFTGIFVLILMTLMLLYATRVGIFEQRVSANEARQKVAFHAAEAAIDQALEYVRANTPRLFRASAEAMPIGDGNFRAGWFAADGVTPGWQPCPDPAPDNHPCGGDIPAAPGSFFYDDPATATGTDSLPINMGALPGSDTTTARVSMIMCIVPADDPAGDCQVAPASEELERTAVGMIQLMGYGYTDCTDTDDLDTCTTEARVARPLANFKTLNGKPVMPLTTKTSFDGSGTAEVVPNPNAGGIGAALSVWSNDNANCPGQDPADVTAGGAWNTCELHEWYGRDVRPDDVACDITPCRCHKDEALSYAQGNEARLGIDVFQDEDFPCDLFEYYFGVPRAQYQPVKDTATVISDCTSLGPHSHGLYWVSGSNCKINANTVIGSPENPIILVSAAQTTTLAGRAEIFGVLYIFDGEHTDATLNSSGTSTVYGAAVVDGVMGRYTGTFQVVYSDMVLARAAGDNGLGNVSGGWRDFGLPAWQ